MMGFSHWKSILSVRYVAILIATCALVAACADTNKPTTRPASARDRQEQAMQDPFEYGPDEEMPTVSGGGKKGIKRDWDSFWK